MFGKVAVQLRSRGARRKLCSYVWNRAHVFQDIVMKQYGVAIHGAGWVAAEHVRAFDADSRARVVAISSRSESSAIRLAQETGQTDAVIETELDAVLARGDVDVLAVCTPHDLHPANVIAAAEAGKHVLIEKPAALDLAGLRAMRNALSVAGVVSVVGFVLRWNPCSTSSRPSKRTGRLAIFTWPRLTTCMDSDRGMTSTSGPVRWHRGDRHS